MKSSMLRHTILLWKHKSFGKNVADETASKRKLWSQASMPSEMNQMIRAKQSRISAKINIKEWNWNWYFKLTSRHEKSYFYKHF